MKKRVNRWLTLAITGMMLWSNPGVISVYAGNGSLEEESSILSEDGDCGVDSLSESIQECDAELSEESTIAIEYDNVNKADEETDIEVTDIEEADQRDSETEDSHEDGEAFADILEEKFIEEWEEGEEELFFDYEVFECEEEDVSELFAEEDAKFVKVWADWITDTNAVLNVKTNIKTDSLGVRVGTEEDLSDAREITINYVDPIDEFNCNVKNWYGELQSESRYYYQMFIVIDEEEYQSDISSFTTLKETTHTQKKYQRGDIICFGHQTFGYSTMVPEDIEDQLKGKSIGLYEVDGEVYGWDGEYNAYLTIPIRWIVMEDEGDSLLLLSEYVYPGRSYLSDTNATEVTWVNSEIRSYLNNSYYKNRFLADELDDVMESVVEGENWWTIDRFFLPSYNELTTYFTGSEERKAHYYDFYLKPDVTTPITGFSDALAYDKKNYTCAYWTRSSNHSNYSWSQPTYVDCNGDLRWGGRVYFTWSSGVRPMMRIKKASTNYYDAPKADTNFRFEESQVVMDEGSYKIEAPDLIADGIDMEEFHQPVWYNIIWPSASQGLMFTTERYYYPSNCVIEAEIHGITPTPIEITMDLIVLPEKPVITEVGIFSEDHPTGVSLKWLKNDNNNYAYEIWRSEKADGPYDLLYSGMAGTDSFTRNYYKNTDKIEYCYCDDTAVKGRNYYYKVRGLFYKYDYDNRKGEYVAEIDGYSGEFSEIVDTRNGGTVSSVDGDTPRLKKDSDGVIRCYVKGKVDNNYTGLALYYTEETGEIWVYVEKGKRNVKYTGFVDYDEELFYVDKGVLDDSLNGVQLDPASTSADPRFYFCANGMVQKHHEGLAEYDGEWFYIKDGLVQVKMNAFVEYDGGIFAVGAGRIISEYSGLMQDPQNTVDGDWYYFALGQAQTQYTGLVEYDTAWFYIDDGKLNNNYTGAAGYNGKSFPVVNGCMQSAYDYSGYLSLPKLSPQDIQEWYAAMNYSSDYYFDVPSANIPYNPGVLSDSFLQSGLSATNLVRAIAGVPSVELDPEYNTNAQYAALVNAANGYLDHYPSIPDGMDESTYQMGYEASSKSNLGLGHSGLSESVLSYMRDSGSYKNMTTVGHRRWVIDPRMTRTGFGYVGIGRGGATAMYVIGSQDFSNRAGAQQGYFFVAWPSSGYFPVEYTDFCDTWSISLNPSVFDTNSLSAKNICVTVTSQDGRKQVFQGESLSGVDNKNEMIFTINRDGYGSGPAILFRPGTSVFKEEETGTFHVEVSGLYDKQGNVATLEYDVNMY
ncbi:MAG: CAP domain-containing protein [Lachnospiraceae bacterium]|nr:CAP domain-containing protein [Lachnospiraceae bacterium]